MRLLCALQTNCLEELTRPAPNHQGMAGRSDWVHIYHSVLPVLSLHQVCLLACANSDVHLSGGGCAVVQPAAC
jgi:hypothetical protein